MKYKQILELPAEELYEKAMEFKNNKDYDNYCIYMIMSANYNYKLAVDDIMEDYNNHELYKKQNFTNTKLFYKATENYSYSCNCLGIMYDYGFGVKQNYEKAKKLYKKSIKKGNPDALYNLAIMYQWGAGVKKDLSYAVSLYKMAIAREHVVAINNLGHMYHYGEGVTRDQKKAKELYEKAIEKGSSAAIYNLVNLYKHTDLKKNKEKAIKYFTKINKPEKLKDIYDSNDNDKNKAIREKKKKCKK